MCRCLFFMTENPCTDGLFQHIVTCHGSTLLPQFLAMYRVTVESEDTYLLVMRNMFSYRLHVHRKYDLKVILQRQCISYDSVLLLLSAIEMPNLPKHLKTIVFKNRVLNACELKLCFTPNHLLIVDCWIYGHTCIISENT